MLVVVDTCVPQRPSRNGQDALQLFEGKKWTRPLVPVRPLNDELFERGKDLLEPAV
jgi:hypothetical protein